MRRGLNSETCFKVCTALGSGCSQWYVGPAKHHKNGEVQCYVYTRTSILLGRRNGHQCLPVACKPDMLMYSSAGLLFAINVSCPLPSNSCQFGYLTPGQRLAGGWSPSRCTVSLVLQVVQKVLLLVILSSQWHFLVSESMYMCYVLNLYIFMYLKLKDRICCGLYMIHQRHEPAMRIIASNAFDQ